MVYCGLSYPRGCFVNLVMFPGEKKFERFSGFFGFYLGQGFPEILTLPERAGGWLLLRLQQQESLALRLLGLQEVVGMEHLSTSVSHDTAPSAAKLLSEGISVSLQ